jgi:protein phosphatase PTC1
MTTSTKRLRQLSHSTSIDSTTSSSVNNNNVEELSAGLLLSSRNNNNGTPDTDIVISNSNPQLDESSSLPSSSSTSPRGKSYHQPSLQNTGHNNNNRSDSVSPTKSEGSNYSSTSKKLNHNNTNNNAGAVVDDHIELNRLKSTSSTASTGSSSTSTRLTRTRTRTAAAAATSTTTRSSPKIPDFLSIDTVQGPREYQEDRFDFCIHRNPATTTTITSTGNEENKSSWIVAIGVYDGHGGEACSEYSATNLLSTLIKHKELFNDTKKALVDTYSIIDKTFCELEKKKQSAATGAGSTATVAVIRPVYNNNNSNNAANSSNSNSSSTLFHVSLAVVGDSRAAILRRSHAKIEILTPIHHGSRRDERRRIEKLGGVVLFDEFDQLYRVAGVLAVTRSLGDSYLKPYVSGDPETRETHCERGDLIIVASDGLWDHASEKEITDVIKSQGDFNSLSKRLVKLALRNGGDDNTTVLVLNVDDLVKVMDG